MSKINEMMPLLADIYENRMPFNKILKIKIESLEPDDIRVRMDMREEFIGNFVKGILHGGVISSVMDLTGGIIASVGLLEKMEGLALDEMAKRFARMGTIDLRVDYLRPGKGKFFICSGNLLRNGKRVAVTRMEFHNDENLLIAAGTGTYVVG